MLFKISQSSLKDFFKENPEAKVINAFKSATSAEMVLATLYSDPRSPLRALPEKERYEEAARSAGVTKRTPQIDKLIAAYKRFCGVDAELESLEAIGMALTDIQGRLKATKGLEPDDIKKLVASITELLKQKNSIESMINDKLQIEVIDTKAEKAESQLSLADRVSMEGGIK